MKESGYYPAGAEFDPKAPYNEQIIPDNKIDIPTSIDLENRKTNK